MQEITITKGSTSQIIPIIIYDSLSLTGAKLAGLAFDSAGLTVRYNRTGATGVTPAITLVAATKGEWLSSGFSSVDAVNVPGNYELHVPNNVIASGADSVIISLAGAENMVPVDIKINLTSVDMQDSVSAGVDVLDDLLNDGRLDLIIDAIAANVENINGDAMRGTDDANIFEPLDAQETRDALKLAPSSGLAEPASIDNKIDLVQLASSALLSGKIRRNQSFANIPFPMKLNDEFVSGLAISGQRSFDGVTFTAVAGEIQETGNGMYNFDATAADTNGGRVVVYRFTATGADATLLPVVLSD